MNVSRVRLTPASLAEQDRGLLGFVTAVLDGKVLLDRIALRRTREGRLALSFPSRTDRDGRRHHVVRPLTDAARREIEAQILSSLGLAEEAAP